MARQFDVALVEHLRTRVGRIFLYCYRWMGNSGDFGCDGD